MKALTFLLSLSLTTVATLASATPVIDDTLSPRGEQITFTCENSDGCPIRMICKKGICEWPAKGDKPRLMPRPPKKCKENKDCDKGFSCVKKEVCKADSKKRDVGVEAEPETDEVNSEAKSGLEPRTPIQNDEKERQNRKKKKNAGKIKCKESNDCPDKRACVKGFCWGVTEMTATMDIRSLDQVEAETEPQSSIEQRTYINQQAEEAEANRRERLANAHAPCETHKDCLGNICAKNKCYKVKTMSYGVRSLPPSLGRRGPRKCGYVTNKCAQGEICTKDGCERLQDPSCVDHDDCNNGMCINNVCFKVVVARGTDDTVECQADRDCPIGNCNDGACFAPSELVSRSTINATDLSLHNKPRTCSEKKKCPLWRKCENGICVYINDPACKTDKDCEGGTCAAGICLAGPPSPQRRAARDPPSDAIQDCSDTVKCPRAHWCNKGTCQMIMSRCETNDDCAGGTCMRNICFTAPPPVTTSRPSGVHFATGRPQARAIVQPEVRRDDQSQATPSPTAPSNGFKRCDPENPCPTGLKCTFIGICVKPRVCNSDTQCKHGTCSNGTCQAKPRFTKRIWTPEVVPTAKPESDNPQGTLPEVKRDVQPQTTPSTSTPEKKFKPCGPEKPCPTGTKCLFNGMCGIPGVSQCQNGSQCKHGPCSNGTCPARPRVTKRIWTSDEVPWVVDTEFRKCMPKSESKFPCYHGTKCLPNGYCDVIKDHFCTEDSDCMVGLCKDGVCLGASMNHMRRSENGTDYEGIGDDKDAFLSRRGDQKFRRCNDTQPCDADKKCLPNGYCSTGKQHYCQHDTDCKNGIAGSCNEGNCLYASSFKYRRAEPGQNGEMKFKKCGKKKQCPKGTTCRSNGYCDAVMELYCMENGDCGAGGTCKNGVCFSSSATPSGEMDVNCHKDGDCEGGYCVNGICLADPMAEDEPDPGSPEQAPEAPEAHEAEPAQPAQLEMRDGDSGAYQRPPGSRRCGLNHTCPKNHICKSDGWCEKKRRG